MNEYPIRATIKTFSLKDMPASDDAVVVPTVKGTLWLKYGKHAYYFYNFAKHIGVCVEITHRNIIAPGFSLFIKSLNKKISLTGKVKLFFERFHYGFSFLEQIMLMTVPHAVTSVGEGKFLINLWSYVGYLEIDCKTWKVRYLRGEGQDDSSVLGSQQWLHNTADEIYSVTYSLPESLKKIASSDCPVSCKVLKKNRKTGAIETIWSGVLSDYLHDIMVNKTGQYCVVCELGMFQDNTGLTIPSKVLVVDMIHKKYWIISKFIVAAHAQFDPLDPDTIYFSNHNFKFIPTSIVSLMRKAIYSLEFTGPAAVYKYRLTPQGPQEVGVFSQPDMFRLTNFHVFMHRGKKVLAAMGFPNFIYLADAQTMQFMRKLTVSNPVSYKFLFRKPHCFIGTFSPSSDGECLYVQTTRSFQIIDVASSEVIHNEPLYYNHTAANHMQTTSDAAWMSPPARSNG